MIRMLLVFFLVFALVSGSIMLWNAMSGKEKWEFTKILFRGIIISMVTVTILTGIVVFF